MTSTRANAVDKSNEQSLNRFDDWTSHYRGLCDATACNRPHFKYCQFTHEIFSATQNWGQRTISHPIA